MVIRILLLTSNSDGGSGGVDGKVAKGPEVVLKRCFPLEWQNCLVVEMRLVVMSDDYHSSPVLTSKSHFD